MELNIFSDFNSIFNLYPNPSNACLSPNHRPTPPTPRPSVPPLLSQPPIAGPTSPVTKMSPNHSMRNNRSNQRSSPSSSRPSRPRKPRSRRKRSRRDKHISSHSMPRRSLEAESSRISRPSREDSRLKNWKRRSSISILSEIPLLSNRNHPKVRRKDKRKKSLLPPCPNNLSNK